MKLKELAKYGLAATGLLALVVGQVAPASAVGFNYSQSTGFVQGTATTVPGFPVVGVPATTTSGVEFFQPSVNPDPARIASVDRLIAEVAKTGCQLVLATDSEQAAAHAAAEGLIDASALAGIRADVRADAVSPPTRA